MPVRPRAWAFQVLAAALCAQLMAGPARAAAPDDNIEWNGISHVGWQDRRPLCPVGGESFQVRFQTWANDLTSARVSVDAGASSWVDASKVGTRGPHDIWAATVPATGSAAESYWIELTDGTDTDYVSPAGLSDDAPASGWVLDFTTLEHAPIGATRTSGGGAVFKVWAPTRTTAHVRGEFNSWGLGNPMTKVGEHFIAFVPAVGDRQMYKYFFNNATWNTDARARSLNPSQDLNAHVEDPFRYVWQNDAHVTPPFEEMVVYQLHIGTFAGRNDPLGTPPFPSGYAAVAARAGHLAELGVNAVMFNPFTEFPGDLSVGYNPQSMWAPEWKYGTPDQLKAMVDALHAHGIAVILDIVWNHFTVNENFMWNYDGSQQYFDSPHVDTPWGAQADFDKLAVRDYYAESALYWLEEYRLDGFRMDATDYMNLPAQAAAGWALMQRLNDDVDRRWADKITIAEQLPNDSWVTRPTSLGGAGFDTQYHDAFTDQLRQEILDAAFGDADMWRISNIVNGSGQYLEGRYAFNYLELHDEAWPSSGGQRLVKTIDTTFPHDDQFAQGRLKLGLGLVLLAPGVPAFLMGDEWLEDTDFGSDIGNRIDWSKKTTYAPHYQYMRDLIGLRTGRAALRADAARHVFHINEGLNVIAFRRWDGAGDEIVVVANFSNSDRNDYRLGLPVAGDWVESVNSQAVEYGGAGPENGGTLPTEPVSWDGYAQSRVLNIPKMGVLVLEQAPTTGVPGATSGGAGIELGRVMPSPARGSATVSLTLAREARASVTVHDVTGRRVATLLEGPLGPGSHTLRWNGALDDGSPAAAGVYVLRASAGGATLARRFALLR
jgi:1,4-alpha-glucan branching enzyme